MRMRDYSAAKGQFTSVDPVAQKAGSAYGSSYSFVGNRPTSLSDPSGACAQCFALIGGAVVGAAIGGVTTWMSGGNVGAGMAAGAISGVAATGTFMLTKSVHAAGAVGSLAYGASYAWMTGQKYTAKDALFDLALGGVTAGGGALAARGLKGLVGAAARTGAGSAAARAASRSVAVAIQKASAWQVANKVGSLPAELRTIFGCAPSPAPTASRTTATVAKNSVDHIEDLAKMQDGVEFGNNPNSWSHAFRHVLEEGMDPDAVAKAVRADVKNYDLVVGQTKPVRITVNGRQVEYVAYKRPGGINIGRMTVPLNPPSARN